MYAITAVLDYGNLVSDPCYLAAVGFQKFAVKALFGCCALEALFVKHKIAYLKHISSAGGTS